jgi:hypothetical protein
MKNYKKIFLLLIVLIVLSSCKKEEKKIEINTKKYIQLKKANWFIGNWENVSKEMQMKELWKKENDSCFSAVSFVTVQKDTIFYEKVSLVQRKDSLLYIVSVREQNKEKPVSFYMTKSSENQLVFENPKHDFPNKIEYNKITNDSMLAKIYGIKDGKEISEDFPMKRSK